RYTPASGNSAGDRRMRTTSVTAALCGLLLTASLAFAQPPGGARRGPPPEPSLMTYELAAAAMAAAEAHARENGWASTIRITDQNDNVVMGHRLDNANPFTAMIAERKTLTVSRSGMTSAEYGAKAQADEMEEI